jgi:hypothetical protein
VAVTKYSLDEGARTFEFMELLLSFTMRDR